MREQGTACIRRTIADASGPSRQEWHTAYRDPRLWSTIDLAGSQDASGAFEHHLVPNTNRFQGHLDRVTLQFAVGVSDKHLAWLQQFSTITDLNLDACHGITDAQLQRLLPALTLRSLSLYWQPAVTDDTLFLIAAFNTSLRRLTLSACQKATDAGLATVATACRQLTYLDLTRCAAVSRATCTAVGRSCPALQTLLLYANAAVDDACLAAFAPLQVGRWVVCTCTWSALREVYTLLLLLDGNCCAQCLRELDVCGARLVSDAGVQALAACRSLTKVNLTWVPQVTDAGVVPLVRACRLQWLSLHGNVHITDVVVEALVEGSAGTLVALDLGGCVGVVHRTPQELLQRLPRLQSFKLHS